MSNFPDCTNIKFHQQRKYTLYSRLHLYINVCQQQPTPLKLVSILNKPQHPANHILKQRQLVFISDKHYKHQQNRQQTNQQTDKQINRNRPHPCIIILKILNTSSCVFNNRNFHQTFCSSRATRRGSLRWLTGLKPPSQVSR